MRYRLVVLVAILAISAPARAQSASDRDGLMRALAATLRAEPGGSLQVQADDEQFLDSLTATLGATRARGGALPSCGGTVARMGMGTESRPTTYVVVVRVPEFSDDAAIVQIELRCMNTMGGRRANFAKDEQLVFRRDSNGWKLVRRTTTRTT